MTPHLLALSLSTLNGCAVPDLGGPGDAAGPDSDAGTGPHRSLLPRRGQDADPGREKSDADEDGYTTEAGDCDDGDAAANPGAAERCDDGVDNDCDGGTDGGDDVCPLVGTVPAEQGIAMMTDAGDEMRAHRVDGRWARVHEESNSDVVWYDLGALLAGDRVELAHSVGHAESGNAGFGAFFDLGGDTATYWAGVLYEPWLGRTSFPGRFHGVPVDWSSAAADGWLMGWYYPQSTVRDQDGDGLRDAIATFSETETLTTPQFTWLSSTETGAIDLLDGRPRVTIEADSDFGAGLGDDLQFSVLDADGDGADDLLFIRRRVLNASFHDRTGWLDVLPLPLTTDGELKDLTIGHVIDDAKELLAALPVQDVNDDGLDDLLVGWDDALYLLPGPILGDLGPADAIAVVEGVRAYGITQGDLDGDGRMETAVTADIDDEIEGSRRDLYVFDDLLAARTAEDAYLHIVGGNSNEESPAEITLPQLVDVNDDGLDDIIGYNVAFLGK